MNRRKTIRFDQLLKTVTKEEFENFYFSHSRIDTEEHFNIGSKVFTKFVKHYEIVKPKKLSNSKTNVRRYDKSVFPEQKQSCVDHFEDYYIQQVKKMVNSLNNNLQNHINNTIAAYLVSKAIPFKREFQVGSYTYDFKLGKYLLEINPSATHNIWSLSGSSLTTDYHRNKTLNAQNNDFICIHVWDWLNLDAILYHIIVKDLTIMDTGAPVKHIFNMKTKELTNIETDDTVVIYDDGFCLNI